MAKAKTPEIETIEYKEVESAPVEQPELQQPQVITIGDLKSLRDIIQIAADRKIFSVIEMGVVTQLFNQLNGFITAIDEQISANAETPTAE